MSKLLSIGTLAAAALFTIEANAAEVEIPRTMTDKGRYYLMEATTKGGITTTVHKRVGVSEAGYSKTQINCKSMQYRDMGYSEAGPDKIAGSPGKWTEAITGSSKSDLVNFVCSRKP